VSAGARGAIVLGLAVIIGIVGLQILDDSGNGSGRSDVVTPGATTGGGATTTTEVPAHSPADVRLKVYNASGTQGRAQTLTDTLHSKGYNTQPPANLDQQRQGTVIQCKDAFRTDGNVLAFLHIPGATVEPFPSNPPAGADEADCLVIIGT
jgi:hypothetical protein